MAIYQRVILKLSGAALAEGNGRRILNAQKLKNVALSIKTMVESGVQVGVVIGAGNIWRGNLADEIGIEHSTADYMGMIGTIINALAIQNAVEELGVPARVLSAIEVEAVCEPYIKRRAIRHLEKGRVVIFAGGTGNPFFTTDTCAALRALDIEAEAILMAKNGTDGVYSADPNMNPDAQFLPKLTFQDVVVRNLRVMDHTTVSLIKDSNIKIHVFAMDKPENFKRVIEGEDVGTVITKGE
ncbi:MAG: UMP kinase [Bacilli bacterium]|nr:UMP kinase [Bacilli bacterium]